MNKNLPKIKYIQEGIKLGLIKEEFSSDAFYTYWVAVKPFILITDRYNSEYKAGEKISEYQPTDELYRNRELRYRQFLIDMIKGLSNDYKKL